MNYIGLGYIGVGLGAGLALIGAGLGIAKLAAAALEGAARQPEALAPLVSKPIPGFGELFRQLSYLEIGSSTIQSRAEAGVCSGTLIFLLPGSRGGVRLGLQEIVLPQLDSRNRPCSLAELLPRIRHEH